jgi:hypothetical protein
MPTGCHAPVARPPRPTGASLWLAAAALALLCASTPPSAAAWERVDQRRYGIAEALFWQRNNAAVARPALVLGGTGADQTVLKTRDLTPPVGLGTRLLYGDNGSDGVGWEVGYLGVYDMFSRDLVPGPTATLQAAGGLGFAESGFNEGVGGGADYASNVNSVEANAVFHRWDGGFNRGSRYPWQRCVGYDGGSLDWLAGFRWAELDETARLGILPDGAAQPNLYTVESTSNLFAAQTGVRGRMAFERWALEGWMKIGIAGTALAQSQSMTDALTGVPYRSPRSSDAGGMGMIADMNLSAVWRITEVWGVRAGYNLFWLTGVALAPDQWDFSAATGPAAGTALRGTGSVFFNGANLGLEARW